MRTPRTGLLLVNLGTPAAPTTAAVRPYLREFLMDGRVISIPAPLRWMLVNGVIAPFRAPKSAHAYESVWSEEGSPLLAHGKRLLEKVRTRLPHVVVELAMRYGEPSIESVLGAMINSGVEQVVVFPLYPQTASATTGSTLQCVMDIVGKWWSIPAVTFVPPFYDDDSFIKPQAALGRPVLDELKPDHIVFSFHGLPEDHVTRTAACCLKSETCCESMREENRFCYRAQCHASARALAAELELSEDEYSITFQSRLGRAEWIKPYTADSIEALGKSGKKRVAVFCPAFVADCLETIEEIGVEARDIFKAAGGDELRQVPCVNDEDAWADGVVALARATSGWLAGDKSASSES